LGSLKAEFTHNKLVDLKIAKKCNISVPESYIISNKLELSSLLKNHTNKEYITKAI